MSQEKQIEELATEIYSLFRSDTMSRALARRLYGKGWRKQSEGEWIEGDYGETLKLACSACGSPFEYRTTYCPDCGAKMKGE